MPFTADWAHPRRFAEYRWHHPADVDRGLAALERVLGEKLFWEEYTQHPLGLDYSFRRRRWRLIEAGVMLADLPAPGDYAQRLRDPNQYVAACAELQAGLYLRCLGFWVQRDPANAVRGQSAEAPETGPDWLAIAGPRMFGVEVKCPLESDEVIGLNRLRYAIFDACQQIAISHSGLDIQVRAEIVPSLVRERTVFPRRVEEVVLEALVDLKRRGHATTRLGLVRPSGTRMSSISLPPPSQEREVSRLRDLLQKAATQLGVLPHPGVVILDASYDRVLPFRCCDIAEILEEPFASEIAFVIVAVPTLPGAILTLIPGRRHAKFERCALPGLGFCGRHLHVCTLAPKPDCSFEDIQSICPSCFSRVSKRRR